jgi:hypothetical protein
LVARSYLGGPRPVDEYKALADSGAKWMGMGDAGISFRPPANGTVPDGYVEGWIDKLEPAMANLSALGLLDKAYVYGFDEVRDRQPHCGHTVPGGSEAFSQLLRYTQSSCAAER